MKSMINQNAVMNREIVTAKDVAKKCGVCRETVSMILNDRTPKHGGYKPSTIARVKKVAAEMNYSPARARRGSRLGKKRLPESNSTSGNFSTLAEETARMQYLRDKKLMTNAEIAKKVGVSYFTVLRRIGYQPAALTQMSFTLRGERVARRNQARREILNQRIAQFEKAQQEYASSLRHAEQLEAESARIMAESQRLADEARNERIQLESKVIELSAYREEAESAAKILGRSLA